MTIIHVCSAPVLALVIERKLPFSAAFRYHPLTVPHCVGRPGQKVLFSVLETSQSSVAPAKLKHRFGYLTNYFLSYIKSTFHPMKMALMLFFFNTAVFNMLIFLVL